jgi:hypothetical protein
MHFPAFLDTCTLFGAYLCDTLLRLAEAEVYRPLWSAQVLEELDRNLRLRGAAGVPASPTRPVATCPGARADPVGTPMSWVPGGSLYW